MTASTDILARRELDLMKYCERAIAIHQDYMAGKFANYEHYRAYYEARVIEWKDELLTREAAPQEVPERLREAAELFRMQGHIGGMDGVAANILFDHILSLAQAATQGDM